jgi:spore coat polysaccharide biosynthesis predicted glycosyltransferase SpsG
MDETLETIFIGNYNEFAINRLNFFKVRYVNVPNNNFSELYVSNLNNYDYILFDSYLLSDRQIEVISNLPNKTIVIDDLCMNSFDKIDFVINFRCNANSLFSYKSRNSFLGISYLIVSPELVYFRKSRLNITPKQFLNVTLFFGGAFEQMDKIEKVVEALYRINPLLRVNLVSRLVLDNYPNINYILPNGAIENIFEKSDFLIAGGGLIKYEAAFAMIPTFSFSTNELQKEDNELLAKENILVDLGPIDEFSFSRFSFQISNFFDNIDKLKSQLNKNFSIFEANPTLNLVKCIINKNE